MLNYMGFPSFLLTLTYIKVWYEIYPSRAMFPDRITQDIRELLLIKHIAI